MSTKNFGGLGERMSENQLWSLQFTVGLYFKILLLMTMTQFANEAQNECLSL